VLTFPNCKINLGLHILRKRTDGFHDLETVFYPIDLKDALEIVHGDSPEIIFSTSGNSLDIPDNNNICIKAYTLLKKDYAAIPPVKMHLHKSIPSGAGLGGGSADGAFTLLLLNQKFQLKLTEEQLLHYALLLGSDCPFFIKNKPCFGTGRGEHLEPIGLDLSAYTFIIVNPGIHINTGQAFKQLTPDAKRVSVKEIIQQPIPEWKNHLKNDFEEPIFQQYPEINSIKISLYQHGALYAAMSGTGSTVFGIFAKDQVPSISFSQSYFVRTISLP
jgi:4-diphosphocytidyl-2-C-methyl-D-erythritol kinase